MTKIPIKRVLEHLYIILSELYFAILLGKKKLSSGFIGYRVVLKYFRNILFEYKWTCENLTQLYIISMYILILTVDFFVLK